MPSSRCNVWKIWKTCTQWRGVIQSTLKNKRSTVKRKVTLHLKNLAALVEQRVNKTRINRIIAEELNVEYISFVPKNEQDKVLEWYDVEVSSS